MRYKFMKKDIIETIYEISEEFDVIMKNHIVINKDLNVILFAHYCSSELFYKHFYKISKEVFQVNNLAKIQVEGGIVQGIGMALYEDVVYTQRGELASNTFMQYKMPTRKDVGNIIVDFEESYEPTGPFGAKSVGEVVVNTPSPAIENAIYNGLGINLNTLPMTPEKVFMAMTNK